MLPKQEQHKAGKHNEYDPVNLVSISLSDLLPSSLGDALPSGIQISVSPKLPPPNGRRAFYNGRRRSSSLSRWRFIIPRHLPLWVRWTLLSMIVFVMMLQTLLRGQTVPDRRKVYLAGKSKLNWAFTRLKPQKVAIYCGRNSDFEIVNSIITGISLDGIRQRVKPSIYAEHTRDYGKLMTGQSKWIQSFTTTYSKPLSLLRTGQHKPDILFFPPSETPLNAIIDILNVNKKSRAIFVIKDPNRFILSFLDDLSLPAFQKLLKLQRISFLMTEKRHSEFFTKKLISLINEGGGGGYMSSSRIAERVRSYIPLMDLPTRQQFPNQGHQRFLRYGVFYNEDNSELSIKHISSLIYDLGEWIKEDNDDSTGYNIIRNETTGLNVIQKQRKGKGIVTLHIFFPPHIGKERKNIIKEQIYIPESIKPAIYIHEQSNPHSLYGIVARMHVLLPSYPYQFPANNTEDPDPYEPIVPIGLSTRTRILLPHSLTSAYFRRLDIPALISYPDDPDSIKPGKKQIKIMKAISLIKKFMNPRFTMAFRGSPWITLDHPASWNRLLKRFKDDNINTFADILSM